MSRQERIASLGALLALLAALGAWRPSAPQAWAQSGYEGPEKPRVTPKLVPQRQWEYKQAVTCLPPRGMTDDFVMVTLDEQGRRGWELVALTPMDQFRGRAGCYLATFKREQLH